MYVVRLIVGNIFKSCIGVHVTFRLIKISKYWFLKCQRPCPESQIKIEIGVLHIKHSNNLAVHHTIVMSNVFLELSTIDMDQNSKLAFYMKDPMELPTESSVIAWSDFISSPAYISALAEDWSTNSLQYYQKYDRNGFRNDIPILCSINKHFHFLIHQFCKISILL